MSDDLSNLHAAYALLRTAVAPLTPESAERIVRHLVRIGDGDGFLAVFCPPTRVCFTGLVVAGRLVTWSLFPAEDEASAHRSATLLHEFASLQVQGLHDAAQAAAAAVLDNARAR